MRSRPSSLPKARYEAAREKAQRQQRCGSWLASNGMRSEYSAGIRDTNSRRAWRLRLNSPCSPPREWPKGWQPAPPPGTGEQRRLACFIKPPIPAIFLGAFLVPWCYCTYCTWVSQAKLALVTRRERLGCCECRRLTLELDRREESTEEHVCGARRSQRAPLPTLPLRSDEGEAATRRTA